jgi:integrase
MARPGKPWFRAGKGGWYCTLDGRKVSLGVRGRNNVKAAEEAWHRLMAGVGEGRKQGPAPTVGELVRLFLADCADRLKLKTLIWYRSFLDPFAARYGSLKASALTPTTAEAYARRPGWGPSTRHGFLGTLAGAFKWAERARLIERTPLAGLRRPPKASRGLETLISREEHERLCSAATAQFRVFLNVLYDTGARPGEVAAITSDNFDGTKRLVRLKEHKTAHRGRERIVYLTPETAALLSCQKRRYPTGALLRNRCGRPWTVWAVVKAMEATRLRAGVGQAVAYGYRHSFATDALANGVPDAQVAELLGHSGTAMLHKHYSHLTARSRALRDALGMVRGSGEEERER